jgi:hypothetical protein
LFKKDKILDEYKHKKSYDKAKLLFGVTENSNHIFIKIDEAKGKALLETALKGIEQLRNNSFHFKGLDGFIKPLLDLKTSDNDTATTLQDLWKQDSDKQQQAIIAEMEAVDCHIYFEKSDCNRITDALFTAPIIALSLPRFNRVLTRVKNVKSADTVALNKLPNMSNRTQMEASPALRCQYKTLHMLYNRPFKAWLKQTCNTARLNGYIDSALKRTTSEAKKLNNDKNKELIQAKASIIEKVGENEDIHDYFRRLSAATASEMRVQNYYHSDGEQAREQAAYLEEMKYDVIALAFAEYLRKKSFLFILALTQDTAPPYPNEQPYVKQCENSDAGEPWQHILYFLIHLIPVETIANLLHQLRKWDCLTEKSATEKTVNTETVKSMMEVLELYLTMHDAQFFGDFKIIDQREKLKPYFSSETLLETIYPSQENREEALHVPKRGLRELLRFGDMNSLEHIFKHHNITYKQWNEYQKLELGIKNAQQKREYLHEKWVENKKLNEQDKKDYVTALRHVEQHRHLSAHISFTNHIRLHRLMMDVLGRLVDYSGLWERDLYFVTLALIHNAGKTPKEAFNGVGRNALKQGKIIEALSNIHEGDRTIISIFKENGKADLRKSLNDYFELNKVLDKNLRKNFAHFNMLHEGKPPVNLTECVNNARELMSYDRKLKNAVSKSIMELLEREGIILKWNMENHKLNNAQSLFIIF